jgi:hyperosmotically inducible protein
LHIALTASLGATDLPGFLDADAGIPAPGGKTAAALRPTRREAMSISYTRPLRTAAMVLAIAAGLGLTQRPVARADAEIWQEITQRLAGKDIQGIDVAVSDGAVTLTGSAASLWAKNEAVEQARKTDHVASVSSEIAIARGESDAAIAEKIADRIQRYVFFTIYDDADVSVNEGIVTLYGRVTMPYKADALANLASQVKGVQEIDNQIQSLPVSAFDDHLRYTIARRIYNDPVFWNYAIQLNPPIHIVVENGRVTLTGAVASELERRMAEVVARSTFGVFEVTNKLRVERDTE